MADDGLKIDPTQYKIGGIQGASEVTKKAKGIVDTLRTIGMVVVAVGILVLGIKYMIGSTEEKAKYKETMKPYIIGCIMIFATTTILSIISVVAGIFN